MDLISHLEIYIDAQKGVSLNAYIFGTGMLIAAILLHLYGGSHWATGLRNGTFVIGILLFLMGISLRISQGNILQEKKVLYQKDPTEFKKTEIERMTKVKNNYPKQQKVMALIVALTLLAFLLFKSPVWQGVSLSVTVFMVGNMIIEAFSNLAILAYYEQLVN